LFWVDIDSCQAHGYWWKSRQCKTWDFPEKLAWLLAIQGRNEILGGFQSGIYIIDIDRGGERQFVMDPEPGITGNRLNDAVCDIQGCVWTGTMDDKEIEPSGWFYRIDTDLTSSVCDGPFVISNGPAISPDDRTLYHVDTVNRSIYAYTKHHDGTIHSRRLFKQFDKNDGNPDGLTIDSEGYIWVAHWGGGKVSRLANSGVVDFVLEIPALQVTNCIFGGPEMNLLFVSTAARNVGNKETLGAGSIFYIETNVIGPQPGRFDGSKL